MKSQLLVIGFVVLIIAGISSLLINTNFGNASVSCVDRYNHTSVISCSDKNAVDISTSGKQAITTASNMTNAGGPINITASNRTNGIINGSSNPSILPILQVVKSFVADAVQAIQNNDTTKALERMNLADQQLSTAGNSTSIQEAKVFVDDAIQSFQQNHDVNTALERLNLADKQLGTQLIQATPGNATKFLKYENSTYGIKMQYPSDWNSVGGNINSSIVAFMQKETMLAISRCK